MSEYDKPLMIFYAGNEEKPLTKEQIEKFREIIRNLSGSWNCTNGCSFIERIDKIE